MRIRWKGFDLPTHIGIDEKTASPTFGEFTAEPFERGFATTIGNSLRRALYSSLEGAAVSSIKIKGVTGESTTLKGLVEDVTDLVLNIKQLIVKLSDEATQTLTLEATKKGPVTAARITPQEGVEIINPQLHICTLASDVDFKAQIRVSRGRRYVTSEEQPSSAQDAGAIAVDSSFSPIKRVRFRVESMRVGKLTNYERLILEIWTDGTITPEKALSDASRTLNKHFNPFVHYFDLGRELQINERKEEEMRKREAELEALRQKLSMSISELDLSVRSANCLSNEKIETLEDLVTHPESDLLKFRNFGKTSLREVKKKLAEMNLGLGFDFEGRFGKKPAPPV